MPFQAAYSQWQNLFLYRGGLNFTKVISNALRLACSNFFPSGKTLCIPLSINILITDKCNLTCKICSYGRIRNSGGRELDIADWSRFIHDVAHIKPSFFISGGEPFARSDTLELARLIKSQKLKLGICTNGLLLDEEKIKTLADLGIENMVFSLFGTQEVHDKLTGQEGAFRRVTENIRLFRQYKNKATKLIINCAISQYNYGSLRGTVNLAQALGVDNIKFEHLNFVPDSLMVKEAENLRPVSYAGGYFDPAMAEAISKDIAYLKNKYKNFVVFKPFLDQREIKGWYSGDAGFIKRRCFFVYHSLFIKPDGTVVPCQFFQNYEAGNIAKDRLAVIWNSARYRNFRNKLRSGLLPGCARCCKL